MTDDARLDLRSLDVADDPARTVALARAVLADVARRPRADDVRELRRYRAVLLAAAVVLAAAALATTRTRDPRGPTADVVAQWARDGHIPTNGELLASYQGYHP